MKLLYINTLYSPFKVGGAEKSVQMLAESMVRKGHEVFVLSLSNKKRNSKLLNGVRIHYLELKNVYWPFSNPKNPILLKPLWHTIDIRNFLMFNEVKGLINSINPDLIHTNNLLGFSSEIWKFSEKYHIPIVHTLRDYYLICPYTKMYRDGQICETPCTRCKAFNYFKKHVSCNVDVIVGISNFILKTHLSNGFFTGSNETHVIGNPVNYPKYLDSKSNMGNKIVFGYLGRLDESKGIEKLLEEILDFHNQELVSLEIAGQGEKEYVEKLKYEYSRNNINFLGYVNAEKFYKRIHYLIVPSLWNEPFGRVIIEANANGVPVIGSDRGAIPELINNNQNGYIFNPEVKGSLSKIISEVISRKMDNYEKLVQTSRDKALYFTSDNISNEYLDVYKKAISLCKS